MNPIVKLLHILSWVVLGLIKLALALLGLFVVPIALKFKHWPKILWLWHNAEGSAPAWFYRKALDASGPMFWWPDWWWYAIRNPVNNARFIFKDREASIETNWPIAAPMEAQQMIAIGQGMAYRWAWSGPFAGYRCVWLNGQDKYSEIWFGWKVGSTVPGMGFTMQWRRKAQVGQ